MEYALRRPERVSRLLLLDTAPARHGDFLALRQELLARRAAADVERMRELTASAAWVRGDLEVDAEYHRLHFALAVRRPELLEEIVRRLRAHVTPETVVTARAIERRLYDETALDPSWDLLPALGELDVPALVLHGEHDFIPLAAAAHIAEALPRARLVVLERCGHFPFLESPGLVREHVAEALAEPERLEYKNGDGAPRR
jgi:proline iminopeptidase